MKRLLLLSVGVMLMVSGISVAQNNALVLNGNGTSKGYIVLNGGTSGTPVYLVVNQSDANGIVRKGTNAGWIISEGEFNYVKWNIRTQASGNDTVPFGMSTTTYLPLTFTVTSAGTESAAPGNILFSTYPTGSDNIPFATRDGSNAIAANALCHNGDPNELFVADRWWIIDAKNYSAKPASSLTFTYRSSETFAPNTITETNLQAQRYLNTSLDCSGWNGFISGAQSGGPTRVSGVIVPAGDLYRAWLLVDNTQPLPVELIYFNARCDGPKVDIDWTTASELNNDYFTVQRSLDAIHFEDVITVPGAGNSNQVVNYHVTDINPFNNVAYYRLRQTDYSGTSTYSYVVNVENCLHGESNEDIIIFLQPGKETMSVLLRGYKGPTTVSLYDMLGKMLVAKTEDEPSTIDFDVKTLSFGVYFVVVMNGDNIAVKKTYISR